jgi:murein DD-endopeptidase MepM/ murein hydrolase activator NlpD
MSRPAPTTRRELRLAESTARTRRPRTRRSTAAATAPVARPAPRKRGRRPLSAATAIAAVSLMAVSLSVPALAIAPAGQPWHAAAAAPALDGQTVSVPTEVTVSPLAHEDYVSARARTSGNYAQMAATFTNYSGPIQWPFRAGVPISTDFGPRIPPCFGCSSFHKGIDMNPGNGSPIQAISAGVVGELSRVDNGGLGVYVTIDHNIDGQRVTSVYAHMQPGSVTVSEGQSVDVGDILGMVGNTGQSTGPHLHFEILLDGTTPTDPYAWLSERVIP